MVFGVVSAHAPTGIMATAAAIVSAYSVHFFASGFGFRFVDASIPISMSCTIATARGGMFG